MQLTRDGEIIRISEYGIGVNLLLVATKALIGWLSGSISIILDAVNNLTDALSSVITIVGTKLANKRPDEKHPFGYGRIEYFASVIIVMIVLGAGLVAFKEAGEKLFQSEPASYSVAMLVAITIGVLVKFFFGNYVKKAGTRLNSDSLVASGTDAISDSFLSFGTLISALVSYFWGWDWEGFLGIIISVMIIKTAWEILGETTDKLLGTRAEAELSEKLQTKIAENSAVHGVYDLTLHNYGPNKIIATAHIQVDDRMNAQEIHHLTRHIEAAIYQEFGIIMTLGIYAANNSGKAGKIQKALQKILNDFPQVKQMHGFYVDEQTKHVFFDLVFTFAATKPEKNIQEITEKLEQQFPEYEYDVIVDTDFSLSKSDA